MCKMTTWATPGQARIVTPVKPQVGIGVIGRQSPRWYLPRRCHITYLPTVFDELLFFEDVGTKVLDNWESYSSQEFMTYTAATWATRG